MLDDGPETHRVHSVHERFDVLDDSGRVIVVCRDGGNAVEYAVLLNEAYRRGYKAGYRDARRS